MKSCQQCANVILKGQNAFCEHIVGCSIICSFDYTAIDLEDFIRDDCPLGLNKYKELREAVQALIDLNVEARKKSGSWKPLQIDFIAEREVWTRLHKAMEE